MRLITLRLQRIIGVVAARCAENIVEYIHELPDWPGFRWDHKALARHFASVQHRQGRLIGRIMEGLGCSLRGEALLSTLTEDVVKSSEIEGELLDRNQVRPSIARRLGIDTGALTPADRGVEGVVETTLDAIQNFAETLTTERLFGWHAALFPAGRGGPHKINVAAWRDDKGGRMQVVSGAMGRERAHYEAPAAARLPAEMDRFLNWLNRAIRIDPVFKAAIAHLWLVTIHPFDDGNGRIARAISDMQPARSEGNSQRFYSTSAQIRQERNTYYAILERTQKGASMSRPWLVWLLDCLGGAIDGAESALEGVLRKARFWKRYSSGGLNERQCNMLNRLLNGFEGRLTSSKWAKIEKCSPDTALRDITHLIALGVIVKDEGGGRSTNYSLAIAERLE